MSEYKKMSDWAKEIGLVSGMIFKNEDEQYDFEINEVRPNEIRVRWLEDNYIQIGFMCNSCFTSVYILAFDPRSENNFKKETQMNLREQLQKNSEEYIHKEMKESKEYKDFSNVLICRLQEFSNTHTEKRMSHSWQGYDSKTEKEMLTLFCAENGLVLKNWAIVWE